MRFFIHEDDTIPFKHDPAFITQAVADGLLTRANDGCGRLYMGSARIWGVEALKILHLRDPRYIDVLPSLEWSPGDHISRFEPAPGGGEGRTREATIIEVTSRSQRTTEYRVKPDLPDDKPGFLRSGLRPRKWMDEGFEPA